MNHHHVVKQCISNNDKPVRPKTQRRQPKKGKVKVEVKRAAFSNLMTEYNLVQETDGGFTVKDTVGVGVDYDVDSKSSVSIGRATGAVVISMDDEFSHLSSVAKEENRNRVPNRPDVLEFFSEIQQKSSNPQVTHPFIYT